jgi:hypothetical protein
MIDHKFAEFDQRRREHMWLDTLRRGRLQRPYRVKYARVLDIDFLDPQQVLCVHFRPFASLTPRSSAIT